MHKENVEFSSILFLEIKEKLTGSIWHFCKQFLGKKTLSSCMAMHNAQCTHHEIPLLQCPLCCYSCYFSFPFLYLYSIGYILLKINHTVVIEIVIYSYFSHSLSQDPISNWKRTDKTNPFSKSHIFSKTHKSNFRFYDQIDHMSLFLRKTLLWFLTHVFSNG